MARMDTPAVGSAGLVDSRQSSSVGESCRLPCFRARIAVGEHGDPAVCVPKFVANLSPLRERERPAELSHHRLSSKRSHRAPSAMGDKVNTVAQYVLRQRLPRPVKGDRISWAAELRSEHQV